MTIRSDIGPFGIVPEWVTTGPISDPAVRLYALLARHADRDSGELTRRRRALADALGWSVDKLDRAKRELVDVGALVVDARFDEGGDRTSNRYTIAFLRPDGRESAATGGRTGAAAVSIPLSIQIPTTSDQPPHGGGGPDPIQALVARYVDEYRSVCNGADPSREWRGIAGREIRRAIANGETEQHIAGCLVVVARERKSPAQLQHVIADSHAGVPRRS